jgi:hypothetical protein
MYFGLAPKTDVAVSDRHIGLRNKCWAQKTQHPEGHHCGKDEQRHYQFDDPAFSRLSGPGLRLGKRGR